MDRHDEPGARRLRIHDIPPPQTCERCGGTAFEGSTTPGPPALQVKLPFLRCTACQRVHRYNRRFERWDAVPVADPSLVFVPLDELDPYIDQWC
jgi:hypothetical protein